MKIILCKCQLCQTAFRQRLDYWLRCPECDSRRVEIIKLVESQNHLSGSCPNLRPRNRSSGLTEDPSDPNGRMSRESVRSMSLTGHGKGGVRQPVTSAT